jgi:uncharacterized membrane-anchored protein YhcB (DUF1043 family)
VSESIAAQWAVLESSTEMIFATTISLILSAAALGVSVAAFVYARRSFSAQKRQTEIMERQEARKQREDQSTVEWAAKFDEAVRLVQSIGPKFMQTPQALTTAYGSIFADATMRHRIETYLINADPGRKRFSARQANSEHLRMPIVQQTIQDVLDCVKRFKENQPESAKNLGL